MNLERVDFKIVAAVAMGAIGGILLSHYLWNTQSGGKPLSKHIATLSKVLKQIEKVDTAEADSLKERIQNILKIIESSYGNTKEQH